MAKELILYEYYSRQDVHQIFAPETRFTPSSGTWGLHGIVKIPSQPGNFVFFVTFGQSQGDHQFTEWISESGILSWQSQPRQTLESATIQDFIQHDENQKSIYLFLKTKKDSPYTYLGRLKYISHDPYLEKPVYILWQILDWNISESYLRQMDLFLRKNKTIEKQLHENKLATISSNHSKKQEMSNFWWRGENYIVEKSQLFSTIREYLSTSIPSEATRFVDWYINIDGNSISPKWIFHLITGVDYDEFDSPTARSKLNQIGLISQKTAKEFSGQTTLANPERRNAFYREIAKILPEKLGEKNRRYQVKVLPSKGQLEIHYIGFPPRSFYVIRRRKELDQIAFWFIQSKDEIKRFVQQLSNHQADFSAKIGMPVHVGHHWERMSMGRIAIEIPANQRNFPDIPTNFVNHQEVGWFAKTLVSFIDATYNDLIETIGATSKSILIDQKKATEAFAQNYKTNNHSTKKKVQRINNATRYAISQFLSDLWQIGEISNGSLTRKYGLRDYHYNLLVQSGLVSWNPDSMVIAPRFIELLTNRTISESGQHSVISLLELSNVRDWGEFHSKTFFREIEISSTLIEGAYARKQKTSNIWEDPIFRPCFLIDYIKSPVKEMKEIEPSDWNIEKFLVLDPIFLSYKRYIHSTLPLEDKLNLGDAIQLGLWENPFFALAIQLIILSDPQTGGVYEYKTSLVLLDGFISNGKLNLYMNGEYVCDLRDILVDVFSHFRWVWINNEEDFMKVFSLLNKIDVLECERDGRVTFTDDFI